MKSRILFPNYFKRVGWMILIPATILGILSVFEILEFDFLENTKVFAIIGTDNFFGSTSFFNVIKNNIADELIGLLFIIGAILVAFSKEKHEDEFIAKIRLESLVWATYVNYAILAFCMIFFYSISFFYVMIFNMFTVLIFFIIRYYYMLYKSNNSQP